MPEPTSVVAGSIIGLSANELWEQLKKSDDNHDKLERQMLELLEKIARVGPQTFVDLSASVVYRSHIKFRANTLLVTNRAGAQVDYRLRIGTVGRLLFTIGAATTTAISLPGILIDRAIEVAIESDTGGAVALFAYMFGNVDGDPRD